MSFYRTYRPQTIDEIDNIAVRETLLGLLNKPKKDLPHAYLFSGPRGAGKTTAARLIAKLFNCENPSTSSGPCGTCSQCKSIAEGRNLDVLEMDAASNRGIDEIRQLRDAINLAPSAASYRVYIIDEVHMLTTEAFNALLKTLEEPPAHAVFILATTDAQKVPVTIKSRCISLIFSKASLSELEVALNRIVTTEKIQIDAAALRLIAGSVDGSFRDAVKLLEQISFHTGSIVDLAVVQHMLSITTEALRDEFLLQLSRRDAKSALASIESLTNQGQDVRIFCVDCLKTLEKYMVSLASDDRLEGWDIATVASLIRSLSRAFSDMKGSAIVQLPLELAVVEFCQNAKAAAAPSPQPAPERVITDQPKVAVGVVPQSPPAVVVEAPAATIGSLSLEKIIEHWADIIAHVKPYNNSIAGVMRSTRPKAVTDGIVTIEAFYTFHKDKLSEPKTKEVLADVLKRLFGEKVKVEIVLGKK